MKIIIMYETLESEEKRRYIYKQLPSVKFIMSLINLFRTMLVIKMNRKWAAFIHCFLKFEVHELYLKCGLKCCLWTISCTLTVHENQTCPWSVHEDHTWRSHITDIFMNCSWTESLELLVYSQCSWKVHGNLEKLLSF
jgi:hypothetical protein